MMTNFTTANRLRVSRRAILSVIPSIVFAHEAMAAAKATSVMVIPSTHKRLAGNANYDYADLYSLVAAFHPDLVGVEIRQEDLACPDTYLHHNDPEEMVFLARAYSGRIFGFDWLGDELQGRAIPEDWWTKQSRIKKLERACNAAPSSISPRVIQLNSRVDALSRQQEQIIETATAASLADGRYDRVTADYYKMVTEVTRGTPCEDVSKWYAERDHQISANVVAEVRHNPGRRITVVTGADHHGPVAKALLKLGSSIVLVPVQDEKRTTNLPR